MLHLQRRFITGVLGGVLVAALLVPPAGAATSFANPAFERQWQQGEAITPNFWGPLANAGDGRQEPYKETGGQRLVQYFDKGRMELTNGVVTNGLLSAEMLRASYQVGDNEYVAKPSPRIPIAGDESGPGPSYDTINTTAAAVIFPADPVPVGTGETAYKTVAADGRVFDGVVAPDPAIVVGGYDQATRHNVARAFEAYRAKAGLLTIGFALSEPFYVSVPINGVESAILVQVYERRVLTYNNGNPDAFKVEMGNVGRIYQAWRYGPSGTPASPATASGPPAEAVAKLIPGSTASNIETISLDGDSEKQVLALVSVPNKGDVAALLTGSEAAWQLAYTTPSREGRTVAYYQGVVRSRSHPGFVVFSHQFCPAYPQCSGGGYAVVRYEGAGRVTTVISGESNGEPVQADAAGKITHTGNVYRTRDAAESPSYTFSQSWTWSENDPRYGGVTFAVRSDAAGPAPSRWVVESGPRIAPLLQPFIYDPPKPEGLIAIFKEPFTITDLTPPSGNPCQATAEEAVKAFLSVTPRAIPALWRTNDGYQFVARLNSAQATAQAGRCRVGGIPNTNGYLFTVTESGGRVLVTDAQVVPDITKIIPADAIVLPRL